MPDSGPEHETKAGKQGCKSGYVAILGPPNAGKSTLLNRLVGRPIAITAARPQTTRHRILGILNGPGFQAVFLDTPGILKPAYELQEAMVREIQLALEDSDVLVLLIDPEHLESYDANLNLVRGRNPLVAINKVDKVDKKGLLPIAGKLAERGFDNVFMISALKGSGVSDLEQAIVSALPAGEPFYPPDAVSDRPERFFAAEMVREAVFNRFGEEIPYATAVVVDEFKERRGRKDFIRATVFVERESQKAILVGRRGAALKRVGSAARRRIERFLGRPVYLELWVKVAAGWRQDERFIRENVYGRQPAG